VFFQDEASMQSDFRLPIGWRTSKSIAGARGRGSRRGDSSYDTRNGDMAGDPRGVCRAGHLPRKSMAARFRCTLDLSLERYPRAEIPGVANGIQRKRTIMALRLRSSIFKQYLLACMMRFAVRTSRAALPTASVLSCGSNRANDK
jgi:hypothetical protein